MTRSTLARLFDCVTIPALRRRTVSLWPDREAFRQFDYADNRWISLTWKAFEAQVLRWRHAFYASGLKPGDRAAMLLTNSIEAVIFDQAALAAGLIPVPLHAVDTPGSSAYILHDSGARILVTSSRARWNALHAAAGETLPMLEQVVLLNELDDEVIDGVRISGVETWLARGNGTPSEALPPEPSPDDLAGLIYTSGTTGRPKGVMLTHANLVANVAQISDAVEITESDIYLSFLPFSHTFERTVAHYAALAHGASMAFARSVQHIENDLADVQPTIMCTVPRVLERLYQKQQLELAKGSEVEQHRSQWAAEAGWRRFCRDNGLPIEPSAREALDETVLPVLDEDVGRKVRGLFGGRMKAILCGGASLNQSVARYFCAMGVPLRQVYGLTETSPIVSLTRAEMNHPACVGQPVAQTQVRLGDRDELQVKGPQSCRDTGTNQLKPSTPLQKTDGFIRVTRQICLTAAACVSKDASRKSSSRALAKRLPPLISNSPFRKTRSSNRYSSAAKIAPSLVLYWFFSLTYGKRSVPKWNSLQTIRRRCTIEACCAIWSNACVPPPKIFLLTAFRGPLPLRTSHLQLKTAFSHQQ